MVLRGLFWGPWRVVVKVVRENTEAREEVKKRAITIVMTLTTNNLLK